MKFQKLNKSDFHRLMDNTETPAINKNHISISFFDFEFEPIEISKILNISPTRSGIKGEKYKLGTGKNTIEKTFESNIWEYEWKLNTNDFIGDIAEKFISEILKPRQADIENLSNSSYVQFQIVQYYYDGCNPGVLIESEYMQVLAKINASLDIDIYCLSD